MKTPFLRNKNPRFQVGEENCSLFWLFAFTLSILYPSCIFQSVFRLYFTSFDALRDAVRVWDFFTISFVAFNLHFHFTPTLSFTQFSVFSSLQLIIQWESHLRATYAQCEDVPLMAPTIGAYMTQSPCDEKLKFLIFNKIFLVSFHCTLSTRFSFMWVASPLSLFCCWIERECENFLFLFLHSAPKMCYVSCVLFFLRVLLTRAHFPLEKPT